MGFNNIYIYVMYYFFLNYAFIVHMAKLMLGTASRIINN